MSQSSDTIHALEALVGEQLRMGERVARIGVDGGERGLADRAMIRVRDAKAIPEDLRRRREHPLRADAADLAADVAAQLDGGRDVARPGSGGT